MTKIIAIANHKGGQGKTTTAVNLGAALTLQGFNVLLIDLDAQRNMTSSLMEEDSVEASVYDSFVSDAPLPIVRITERLHLSPADIYLAMIEREVSSTIGKEAILRNKLSAVKDRYDYIILDTPPSLGIMTVNAFTACTDIYITMTPEVLPVRGLLMLEEIVHEVKKDLNPSLSISGIILTRYQSRKLNQLVEEGIRSKFGDVLFNTRIRENISLAEAPLKKVDIFCYASRSRGAMDYKALAEEVTNKTQHG